MAARLPDVAKELSHLPVWIRKDTTISIYLNSHNTVYRRRQKRIEICRNYIPAHNLAKCLPNTVFRLSSKSVMMLPLKILSHCKCLATLPCEIYMALVLFKVTNSAAFMPLCKISEWQQRTRTLSHTRIKNDRQQKNRQESANHDNAAAKTCSSSSRLAQLSEWT